MQWTRWLLIGVLMLASTSCARRDWVGDLLVLTDVTGTWEGTVRSALGGGGSSGVRHPITLVLQQTGPKVTGELSWSRGQGLARSLDPAVSAGAGGPNHPIGMLDQRGQLLRATLGFAGLSHLPTTTRSGRFWRPERSPHRLAGALVTDDSLCAE